jgi:2-dehydro-3-deoxygalactonokinase
MTNEFLSLDWGTSAFRLRLVDRSSGQVLAEETSDQGIAGTFRDWQQSPDQAPAARIAFYTRVIAPHIAALEKRRSRSLAGLPVVISGMASSTIGLLELPYLSLPFATDGTGLTTHQLPASPAFPHDIYLISGVRSEQDVMRGEETQLIGGMPRGWDDTREGIFIFPGTHSKHMEVRANQVVAFTTYMTGEFFELLAKKSILSATVTAPAAAPDPATDASFKKGVRDAVGANLLHAAFLVRTNHLFGLQSREENFQYLSGLLIGTELQQLLGYPGALYLFGGARLQPFYEAALAELGLAGQLHSLPASWVDESVVRGQARILQQLASGQTSDTI